MTCSCHFKHCSDSTKKKKINLAYYGRILGLLLVFSIHTVCRRQDDYNNFKISATVNLCFCEVPNVNFKVYNNHGAMIIYISQGLLLG